MKPLSKQAVAGFTAVEMIVVVVIIGILAAIAAPGWLAFLNRQRLNTAQAETLSVLRQGQDRAKKEKRIWQACFRDDGTRVKWSVHPVPNGATTDFTCTSPEAVPWNNLTGENSDSIAIETAATLTDLKQSPSGYYMIRFQYKGLVDNVNSKLGKITFRSRNQPSNSEGSTKRCVAIQTILGAMSTTQNNDCKI